MRFAATPRFAASLASLALWALVAGSALYWVWRVRTPLVQGVPVAGDSGDLGQAADRQAVARALGAADGRVATGAGDMAGRFVLRGVVAYGSDAGAALIAVDGKPPKPVRVGAPVAGADGWTLRTVTRRGAVLAGGAREVTLDVPQPDPNVDTHADVRSADMRADGRIDGRASLMPAGPTTPPRSMASRPVPLLANPDGVGGP